MTKLPVYSTILRAHEDWWPHACAVGVFVAAVVWSWGRPLPATMNDLLSASIGVSSIFIAFLTAAKAILSTLTSRRVVKQLKSGRWFDQLLCFFMTAIHWALGLAVLSTVLLLADLKDTVHPILFSMWAATFVESFLTLYRAVALYGKVLRLAETEN